MAHCLCGCRAVHARARSSHGPVAIKVPAHLDAQQHADVTHRVGVAWRIPKNHGQVAGKHVVQGGHARESGVHKGERIRRDFRRPTCPDIRKFARSSGDPCRKGRRRVLRSIPRYGPPDVRPRGSAAVGRSKLCRTILMAATGLTSPPSHKRRPAFRIDAPIPLSR